MTRPCARCGTGIPLDQFLCGACRDEQVRPATARVAVEDAPAPQDTAAPAARTWRGQPIPPGMILPSRTQYHGTMYALIAVGVAITLALAALVGGGVGPFTTSDVTTSPGAGGPQVTATVRNGGSHAGRARCVVTWTDVQGGPRQSGVVQTEVIQPGAAASVTIPLAGLQAAPSGLTVDCK
jgi:hypothetical protein